MLTQRKCKALIDLALSYARGKVDGIEVTVSSARTATSRFGENSMTQNQVSDATTVSVRVLLDGKQSRQTATQTSAQAVRESVDAAITSARLLEKDEGMPSLLAVERKLDEEPAVNRYDRKTARLSPADRARAIKQMIAVATERNLVAAGTCSSGESVYAIGNSEGLFVCHLETQAEMSVTMTAPDSSGWAKAHDPKMSNLDARQLAIRAADKAVGSAKPIELEPGRYTVILEPSAVLDLVASLWYEFAGTSHVDKLSALLDKVGKKVFGDNITIVDDAYHTSQSGAPFDGEGKRRQVVTLVQNGVLTNLVAGRRSAEKLGLAPTGHGLQEPSSMGEYPLNLVVTGGDSSVDRMVSETERGILLTRVWYVRMVDKTTLLLTGMTQDGTFLVENGKVTQGIKNMRFNVSLFEMLTSVLALGPSERTAGEEGFPAVVPAMKVEGFNFTERTKF